MKKKKRTGLDYYIVFVLAYAVIYTIAEQVRLWMTGGMEASALTTGVFGMATGELFAAVLIYRFKIKKPKEEDEV